MLIRRSPNGDHHPRWSRSPGWVVAINRNRWSRSIGMSARDQSESLVAMIRCAQAMPARGGGTCQQGSRAMVIAPAVPDGVDKQDCAHRLSVAGQGGPIGRLRSRQRSKGLAKPSLKGRRNERHCMQRPSQNVVRTDVPT
jgi:hypothetical protein